MHHSRLSHARKLQQQDEPRRVKLGYVDVVHVPVPSRATPTLSRHASPPAISAFLVAVVKRAASSAVTTLYVCVIAAAPSPAAAHLLMHVTMVILSIVVMPRIPSVPANLRTCVLPYMPVFTMPSAVAHFWFTARAVVAVHTARVLCDTLTACLSHRIRMLMR